MKRRKRKSDLAALAQSRAANIRSAIANPRLLAAKTGAIIRDIYSQRSRPAIDDRRDKCACFPPNTTPTCPTFGVANSSYSIQPR